MSRKSIVIILSVAVILIATPAAFAAPDGGALYKAKCASCHGADGGGMTPMGKAMKLRDLRSPEVQKLTDAELIKVTTDGKGKMPAYKGKLSDADISALVAYVRTLK